MPRGLPKNVRISLEKARDSALLAVEIYNKPAVKFKSGGYISLMVIAWTSLFHSIFFRRGIKPFYKKGRCYEKRDGDYCYWELKKCADEYFEGTNDPIKTNLMFFIPLRNMIEHKSVPEIDTDIFAECQSMLLNFDKIIAKEYSEKYCIKECLSFALQLYPSTKSLSSAVLENPASSPIIDFIRSYRSSIDPDILNTGEYSFKAFLIQVANHETKNTVPIQFVNYNKLSDEEKRNVGRIATIIKEKTKSLYIANKDLLKPSKVVQQVQNGLRIKKIMRRGKLVDKFNMNIHTICWKYYEVRPENGSESPENVNNQYCYFDEPNAQYLYTNEWVEFLISEMDNDEVYQSFFVEGSLNV
ncbi:DUF3644 domain-containing protein [Sphingobacterium sp. DR205]|uniref:DUF3644 domain-containing protein n=1 Tax=Sphingobacterium sp. DR205 TaxID=2713573 RepID=UPI0013E51BB6|nr:DUF3644 domain-containing protein [Sphingobacterium sp. DR205]